MRRRFHQEWTDLGPAAAQVIGMRLWSMPFLVMASPQHAVDECWRMVAEKQAAVLEAQMRLAWLPWMYTLRAVAAPLEARGAFEPMLSRALIHPSRRRVRDNAQRLAQLRLVA
jgi:hypothetical protein